MFRKIDESISVAGQIGPDQLADAARQGFTTVINNRPDGEQPGQPTGAEIEQAAREAGLAYHAIPVGHDGFPPEKIAAMQQALEQAEGPVLAFCRSGTRSTFLWALARARMGDEGAVLHAKAAAAGYDITPLHDAIGEISGA